VRRSIIVVGLAFGDEGKGSWVDHLVRKYGARFVVRFNGGAQAAHHVTTRDGLVHCFRQFGSGMLVPGVHTVLTRFMLIEPQALLDEAADLQWLGVKHPLERLIVSEDAPVIAPFNRLFNGIREIARGRERHGSCGFGVGITQDDVETLGERALYVRDLKEGWQLLDKLVWLWRLRVDQAKEFECAGNKDLCDKLAKVDLCYYAELFRHFYCRARVVAEDELLSIVRDNDTVFEGAQGVMLDQKFGTFPHCTRSNCTTENALAILRDARFAGQITRVGLLRGYGTRHGAGPFVTEDPQLAVPACDNGTNPWQGKFRVGWFDAVAARYALRATGGVDVLAVTNLDRMAGLPSIKVATRYQNGDPRFFSPDGQMLDVGTSHLEWLRARTASMMSISPGYIELPGWSAHDASGALRYCQSLSEAIGQPVTACSLVADDRKTYFDD